MEALQGNSWIANIKGALGWFGLLNTLSFGTCWWVLLSMTMKTLITGNLKPQVYSRQDQHIGVFFIGSSTLNLGRKYGSQGYLGNAKHLCGWLFGIVVGLHIVYKKEVFLILSIALSATRRRKTFNTSSSHVFLQGNSGMPCCSP